MIGIGVEDELGIRQTLLKTLGSRGCLAAIDSDDLTGEVVHLVRSQKHDGLSDLLRVSSTFRWHAGDQTGFPLGIASKAVQHPRLDRTGGDRIDPYARSGAFQ